MTGQTRGVVVSFDQVRGFGFIRSPDLAEDVFVHASSVVGGGNLRPGQQVRFLAEGTDRGPRAVRVRPGKIGLPPDLASIVTVIGSIGLVTGVLYASGLALAPAWFVSINVATLAAWIWDKHRSVRDGRRIPEAALLGMAAIGGTVGAVLGVFVLGHKRRKPKFLVSLGVITATQLIIIASLVARP